MPGFTIHLSFAKEIIKLISQSNIEQWNRQEIEEFYIGNILPDVKKTKKLSHYWGSRQMKYIIRIPDLEKFEKEHGSRFSDKRILGYYAHLFVDKSFFADFLPGIVLFMDQEQKPTNLLRTAEYAYLYKTDMIIPYKEFWTDKYYYGDFDKLNLVLQKKYELNANEMIEEIEAQNIQMNPNLYLCLQNELKKYLNKRRAGALELFYENNIITFIEKVTYNFFEWYRSF